MTGSGREALTEFWEALPDVRKWSRGPPGCPGVVGNQSWMYGSGREAITDIREGIPSTPGHPVGALDHSHTSRTAFRNLPDI